ncbi:MAG: type II toxin-antitoxin system VapC family toxin [bacterium]|nr:type II toxin-antitoxin system VapC family toxin [bacterium]MDE0215904.1 type II toxin-antitoxin system VapC family toxin [bacterium]
MTVFLDTSALLKRYANEPNSDVVRDLDAVVVVSELVKVELPSALWRKHRIGEFSARHAQALCQRFIIDIGPLSRQPAHVIKVSTDILNAAADLVARHPLRAYDAVQLASALEVRYTVDNCSFGCFDRQLSTAAAIEGLALLW